VIHSIRCSYVIFRELGVDVCADQLDEMSVYTWSLMVIDLQIVP
jgi:hypothetical protein